MNGGIGNEMTAGADGWPESRDAASSPRIIMGGAPLLGQLTGIGHYTRQLISALREHELVADLKVWGDVGFIKPTTDLLTGRVSRTLRADATPDRAYTTIRQSLRSIASRSYFAAQAYSAVTDRVAQTRLAPFASSHLYHSPNFILPRFDGAKVVTVHDLSVMKFPEFHRRQMVAMCERGILRAIAEGADIIVDSLQVQSELVADFGLSEQRVTTVHLAPDPRCRPRSAAECRSVLDRFGLRYRGFFLCVGTIEPRKNLLRLFDAYRAGREGGLFDWPLVVVGAKGWKSGAEHAALDELCSDGYAHYLNYLDDATLHQLYASTGLLVFPSLYEGFGLPAIEAVASGSRVLTSRGSAMEEFVDPTALLVDPTSVEALTSNLQLAVEENEAWLPANPIARTWYQVALETQAVYRRAQPGFR